MCAGGGFLASFHPLISRYDEIRRKHHLKTFVRERKQTDLKLAPLMT